jgi:hypothetical protein
MLRTYTPVDHPITALHTMLEKLVCNVWCKATTASNCEDLLDADFKLLYLHLDWLKNETDIIYEKCAYNSFTAANKKLTADAFSIHNQIEGLCNGDVMDIQLSTLPEVVQKEIKSLLENFYSRLLDIKQVPGQKLDYYNKLIKVNKYNTCPVCGLADIEDDESNYIEDYDHFFPKAHYPFAAVNFKNLVPTCDKCNKKHKRSKKPLDLNGKAYFPFELGRDEIKVTCELEKIEFNKENKLSEKPKFVFSGNSDKNATWNWLYKIEDRYERVIKRDAYSWLRTLKKEIEFNPTVSVDDYIDFKIKNYTEDRFDEKKFLKIALLEAIKNNPAWMVIFNL